MAKGEDKPGSRGPDRGPEPTDESSDGAKRFAKASDPFDEEVKPRADGRGDPKGRPAAERGAPEKGAAVEQRPGATPRREVEPAGVPRREAAADPEPSLPDVDEPLETPRRRFGFRSGAATAAGAEGRGRRVVPLAGDDGGFGDDPDDADLDELPEPPPRFRRPPWWILAGGLGLALIVVLLLVGEYNTQRYYLVCTGAKAEAHRGRGFPWPFGHSRLRVARYRPVALGDDAQCQSQEMESEAELIQGMLKLVIAEADRRSRSTRAKDLAAARRLVGQGFLLARNDEKARTRLMALRAVLDYQQGRIVMRDLEVTLQNARRLFSQAKAHKTAHAKEAASWILVVDHLLDRLRRRLAGDPKPPERVTAKGPSARPSTGPDAMAPGPDPGRPEGPASRPRPRPMSPPTPAPAPLAVPDAGVSGGGILL